jgi:hypothetical protein
MGVKGEHHDESKGHELEIIAAVGAAVHRSAGDQPR